MIVNQTLADQIAAANGYYGPDPRVVKIIEFLCDWDSGLGYGLVYHGQRNGYQASDVVRSPRVYWEAKLERRL